MGWTESLPQEVQDFMDAVLVDFASRPSAYFIGMLAFLLPLSLLGALLSHLLIKEIDKTNKRKAVAAARIENKREVAAGSSASSSASSSPAADVKKRKPAKAH